MCAVRFTNRRPCPQGNILSKRLHNPQSFWLWRIKNTEAETGMSETALQLYGQRIRTCNTPFRNQFATANIKYLKTRYIYIYMCVCVCVCVCVFIGSFEFYSKFSGWTPFKTTACIILQASIFGIREYCFAFRHYYLIHFEYWHYSFHPVLLPSCLRAGRSGDRIPVGVEIFRARLDRPWYPSSLLYKECQVFPGGKVWPGRDTDPSSPSSAEVKNRVELYLYSP
jgi:hypothetical protein